MEVKMKRIKSLIEEDSEHEYRKYWCRNEARILKKDLKDENNIDTTKDVKIRLKTAMKIL